MTTITQKIIDDNLTHLHRAANTGNTKTDPMMRSAAISAISLFGILIKDINRIADAVEQIAENK